MSDDGCEIDLNIDEDSLRLSWHWIFEDENRYCMMKSEQTSYIDALFYYATFYYTESITSGEHVNFSRSKLNDETIDAAAMHNLKYARTKKLCLQIDRR